MQAAAANSPEHICCCSCFELEKEEAEEDEQTSKSKSRCHKKQLQLQIQRGLPCLSLILLLLLFSVLSYAMFFLWRATKRRCRAAVSACCVVVSLWFLALTLFILNFHIISWNSFCTHIRSPSLWQCVAIHFLIKYHHTHDIRTHVER